MSSPRTRLLVIKLSQTTPTAIFLLHTTAATEIYTLSLHDALPISRWIIFQGCRAPAESEETLCLPVRPATCALQSKRAEPDRKSTRLNSSHRCISYAVFCLKKKKITQSSDKPKSNHKNHTIKWYKK